MYYYQHHIGDYAAATRHLSWLEYTAYRCLELYYRREKPLKRSGSGALAAICGPPPGIRRRRGADRPR